MTKMIKTRIKKRELILALIWLIIIGGIVADSVVRKAYLRFSRLEEEITLNEEKFLRLSAILKQSKEVNSEYEKVISKYKEITDSDNLLQEIEKIANKANINILNIKPTATKDEGLYKSYSLKIEVQDDISSLARFLYTLTEELKSIGVERLQINSQSRSELPKVSLLINAVVFK
jgi:Tfp pilus assembly protein PilO